MIGAVILAWSGSNGFFWKAFCVYLGYAYGPKRDERSPGTGVGVGTAWVKAIIKWEWA